VLALEGLLPRVLADVSAQDAGRRECLNGQGSESGEKELKIVCFNVCNLHIQLTQTPPAALYPENKVTSSGNCRKNKNSRSQQLLHSAIQIWLSPWS